jgi:hypothetical protein
VGLVALPLLMHSGEVKLGVVTVFGRDALFLEFLAVLQAT